MRVAEHASQRPSVLALDSLLLLLDFGEFLHDSDVELDVLLLELAVLPFQLLELLVLAEQLVFEGGQPLG